MEHEISNIEMEEEEEDEDEHLLPGRQIEELEKQNKFLWSLYKEAEEEEHQQRLHGMTYEELQNMATPLSLMPGLAINRGRSETEEEEYEDEDVTEVEVWKDLVPGEHETREVQQQNSIIHTLYQDSLRGELVSITGTSGGQSETNSGTQTAAYSHPHTYTNTCPNTATSSTQSLAAVDCGSRLEGRVDAILAQEPSHDKALQLNLALQQAFRNTISKVEEALRKNQQTQAQVKQKLQDAGWSVEGSVRRLYPVSKVSRGSGGKSISPSLRYSHFCIPYFKDSSGMSAPMNDDAKNKLNAGYLDLYTSRNRAWLTREHKALTEEVKQSWKTQLCKKFQERIRMLQRQIKLMLTQDEFGEDEKSQIVSGLEIELSNAERELKEFSETPIEKIGAPPMFLTLDWEAIAAQAFDGHRSAAECQLMWNNLLHPSINTGSWSEEEDLTIQKHVKLHKKSTDWEAIARVLDTNRTGYLVMQRYVSFILPSTKPVLWGATETKKLLNAVSTLRTGDHIPWSQVHQHLPGFTRSQVYNRWLRVNPENKKIHFTMEEDFIFIKGLYLFGVAFLNVSHFLPGRTATQLRVRFNRIFIKGLTTTPWTRSEDNILIKRGKVSSKGWKKLVMELPRRLPIQLRCRYLTLLVWQNLRGPDKEGEPPPPLFPISLTTKLEEIKEIRKLLICDSSKLKEAVDRSRRGMDLKSLIHELEEKRVAIQQKSADRTAHRVQKLMLQRGRPVGSTNTPTSTPLHRTLLFRFFAPARPPVLKFPVLDPVINSLSVLSDIVQLRLKHTEEKEEEEVQRVPATYLTPLDQDLLEELIKKQEEEGKKDDVVNPDAMPFFPPSRTTVGAMNSIIMHYPTLSEMAQGRFIFQNFSPDTLATMTKTQLAKTQDIRHDQLRLKAKAARKQQRSEEESEVPAKKHMVTFSPSISVKTGKRKGRGVPEGDMEDEDEDSNSQNKGIKIHITSGVDTMQRRGRIPLNVRFPRSDTSEHLYTYQKNDRKPAISTLPFEATPSTSESTEATTSAQTPPAEQIAHDISNSSLSHQDPTATSSDTMDNQGLQHIEEDKQERGDNEKTLEQARKKADTLLFHRMMSLFFWPTMMKMNDPVKWMVDFVEKKVARQWIMTQQEKKKAERKKSLEAATAKPQEEEVISEYIEELSKKLREDIAKSQQWKQECKAKTQAMETKPHREWKRGRKRKRPIEEGSPVEQEKIIETDPEPEPEPEPVPVPTTILPSPPSSPTPPASPPPPLPAQDTDEFTDMGREVTSNHRAVSLQIAKNKHKLKRLNRSLVMKKVWEARRQGNAPPRKKREMYRLEYQPRERQISRKRTLQNDNS